MKNKKYAAEIVGRLKEIYPDAICSLEYNGDPWRLLVMGRLSAQCTDARVNLVTPALFDRYPTTEAFSRADVKDVEELIHSCGFFRAKASNIKECCRIMVEEYGGRVPADREVLLTFPGVGRKVANLLLGDLYGLPAGVCDTHCIRICGRLGMYSEREKNPLKVEKILRELLDLKEGSDFCHRIVIFGREICTARSPKCDSCPISELCESYIKRGGRNG